VSSGGGGGGACLPLASSLVLISKKTLKTFFGLGASFLSDFKIFIQKLEMFELLYSH
jgi:hypothetical protein